MTLDADGFQTRPPRSGLYLSGLVGLFLVVFGTHVSPSAFYLGLAVLLGAMAFLKAPLAQILRAHSTVFFVAGVLFTWVLIRGLVDLHGLSAQGISGPADAVWHHLRVSGLLPFVVGVWVAVLWPYRKWLLALFAAGVLLHYWVEGAWEELSRLVSGRRAAFAGSPQALGLASGLAFVASLGLGVAGLERWLRGRKSSGTVLMGLAAASALVSGAMLIFSQSRSVWFGVIVVLPLCVAGWWYALHRNSRAPGWRAAGWLLFWAVVGVTGVMAVSDIISTRVNQDASTTAAILKGEWDSISAQGSFGTRYHLLLQGVSDLGERPWFGVGPASVRAALESADIPALTQYDHYHNMYLNLGIAMGLPWLILWLGLHLYVMAQGIHTVVNRGEDAIFIWTVLGGVVIFLLASTFQIRMFSWSGGAVYISLMGLLLGACFRTAFSNDVPGVERTMSTDGVPHR